MSLPIGGTDIRGRRGGRTEHQAEGFDQLHPISVATCRQTSRRSTSKEEMKIAGGNRPDPYQLGYFLLGRPSPACAGQPSMMSSVQP